MTAARIAKYSKEKGIQTVEGWILKLNELAESAKLIALIRGKGFGQVYKRLEAVCGVSGN